MRLLPRMTEEVGRAAHIMVEALHFVLGEALLHTEANERLAVLGQPVENLYQGQGLLVWLIGAAREVLHCVDEAARGLDVRNLLQVLLIYHLEVARRGQNQQYTEVEQVLLLELLHACLRREIVGVALVHQTCRGSTVYWIGAQVAELLLDETLPVFVVLQGVR